MFDLGLKQNPKSATSVDKKQNYIIFNRLSVIQNQHRRLVEGHPVLNSNRISQPNNLATPQKYKTQTTINPFIK